MLFLSYFSQEIRLNGIEQHMAKRRNKLPRYVLFFKFCVCMRFGVSIKIASILKSSFCFLWPVIYNEIFK